MYEYIKGIFVGINKDYIIIENNGIGYRIYTSGSTMTNMPQINTEVLLYLQQIVREDFIGLYGFFTKEELNMFNMLMTINGVGSKAALSLLSISNVNNLKYAILTGDEATLIKAPGIGKKTAQRIILELGDKFKNNEFINEINNKDDGSLKIKEEAIEALVALGYSEKEARGVVEKVDKESSVENIIKKCLKLLMN